MTLLWFRILRNFSKAKEFIGCSWVSWQISAKGFDFHKEYTNFLKLFGTKDEPFLLRLLRCSLLLFRHDLSLLLLSIKDKSLDVHRFWIFSLTLLVSSLKPWSYLLIKLDMTTWGFLCVCRILQFFSITSLTSLVCLSHLKYCLFLNVK